MNRSEVSASRAWVLVGLLVSCGGNAASLAPLTGAVAISVGSAHACARLDDGTARCWGSDVWGELGDGETTWGRSTPVAVVGLTSLEAVIAGDGFSCGQSAGGVVSCWGNNIWGQLGNGANIGRLPGTAAAELMVLSPIAVTGLPMGSAGLATVSVNGGWRYTCSLLVDGTVACWGQNGLGLGPTPIASSTAPALIPGLSGVRAMALGGPFACFALADGSVSCLGLGPTGRAGPPAEILTTVPGVSDVAALAAGDSHVCVLKKSGAVACWGNAIPGGPSSEVPVAIDGLADVTAIAAGGPKTCVLLADGGVTCWDSYDTKPKRVSGLQAATSISVGNGAACALVTGGTVRCWGQNDNGRLGDGAPLAVDGSVYVPVPVTVVAPSN